MASNTGYIELEVIICTRTLCSYQSSEFTAITCSTVVIQSSSAGQACLKTSLANSCEILIVSTSAWTFICNKISEVVGWIASVAIGVCSRTG